MVLIALGPADLVDGGGGAQQFAVITMAAVDYADMLQAVIEVNGKAGHAAGVLHVRIKKG